MKGNYFLKIAFFASLLSSFAAGYSQKYQVEGTIRDRETNDPINGAGIILKNSSRGTAANEQGFFRLEILNFPASLFIQCMGYVRDTIVITDEKQYLSEFKNQNRVFLLEKSTIQLNEVQVKARSILFEKDPYAIIDFKIISNHIVALGYKNGNEFRKELLFSDLSGKLIGNQLFKNLDSIYQDCQGNVFAFCGDSAYELRLSRKQIGVKNKFRAGFITDFLAPVCGISDSAIFVKKSSTYRQYDNYFAIRDSQTAVVVYSTGGMMKESQTTALNQIWKQQGQVMITMKPPEASVKSNKDGGMNAWLDSYESQYHSFFESQFRLLVDYPPIFTKMIPLGKNHLIFNREAGTIFWIDENGGINREVGMNTKMNGINYQDVHIDSGAGKIYIEYPQGPFTYFIEISPETGQEIHRFLVRDFHYIEKCKFLNDRLYFLYQPELGKRIKKLHSMWI